MAEKEDVRWGVAQRFEFIEWRAYWVGRVNRSDIEERFGVSTPQASLDLGAYQEVAPGNIKYVPGEKAYLPTDSFQPSFLKLSADRYLIQLNAILNTAIAAVDTWFGSAPPAAVVQTLTRSVEPSTLRAVLRAIEGRLQLDVEYQSLTSTRHRVIVPHSLAFDGHRWHARAWCAERREFRDFVLSRILSVEQGRPTDVAPTDDIEWFTLVNLRIIAHPGLDASQRAVIERDYGMNDGELVVETRAALAYYLIRRLNLDLADEVIAATRKQIALSNLAEIEQAVFSARQEMLRRVKTKSRKGE